LHYPHLEQTTDGEIRISSTRYKAKHLAAEHFQHGWSAEEIMRQHPDLRPEQVYSALTWFYDHFDEVVRDLQLSLNESNTSRFESSLSRAELLRRPAAQETVAARPGTFNASGVNAETSAVIVREQ
jgi:uncharacterized protein (DUF433 family)